MVRIYIVYEQPAKSVIDPGDNAKSILHAVAEEKLTVKYVLLTHAHFDHILAVHDVIEATGAQFVCPGEGHLAAQPRQYGSVPLARAQLCAGYAGYPGRGGYGRHLRRPDRRLYEHARSYARLVGH